MKRYQSIFAAGLALLFTLGCASQPVVVHPESETEKIQIVGEIETPSTAPQTDAETVVTPEPTEAQTPEPTEAPTEVPTPEPTEEPTPEPTEAPTPTPTPAPDRTKAEQFCDVALALIDYPYQPSGRSPETGFDPGGFTYYCLNAVGVKVRHKTSKGYSEYDEWMRVESMDDLEPGDLCFFMTPGKESVNCVCIYLGGGRMIYPSSGEGKVITAKITDNYWKESFVFARRVF